MNNSPMSNGVGAIRNALLKTDFLQKTIPALSTWGVKDEDVMIHSLGVSAWNTLGHQLGYQAVAECPAPFGVGDDIRSDSTWFDKNSQQPSVFIEFERYDGSLKSKQKLKDKLANLMEATYRWKQDSALMILVAWNRDIVSPPDTKDMIQQVRQGFKNRKGIKIPGVHPRNFLLCRFMLEAMSTGNLKLQTINFQEGV